MPVVAGAVRSTFPGSWHVWDHGEKSGFWFPCTPRRFPCSRSQRAHMPDLGNSSGVFVTLPIKGICAIEQLICSYLMVARSCECRERLGQKANSSSKFHIMQLPWEASQNSALNRCKIDVLGFQKGNHSVIY